MPVAAKIFNLFKSLLVSYIITGVMLLIIAFVLFKFGISENAANISILAVYVASSLAGGFVAGRLTKERRFIWGLVLGFMYMVIICLVSFILNGTISFTGGSVITAFIMCIGGGMLGGMLS